MQTHRDTRPGGGVTHSQHGEVLGPVQPPDGGLGLTDPLHHGHVMLPAETSTRRFGAVTATLRTFTLARSFSETVSGKRDEVENFSWCKGLTEV